MRLLLISFFEVNVIDKYDNIGYHIHKLFIHVSTKNTLHILLMQIY